MAIYSFPSRSGQIYRESCTWLLFCGRHQSRQSPLDRKWLESQQLLPITGRSWLTRKGVLRPFQHTWNKPKSIVSWFQQNSEGRTSPDLLAPAHCRRHYHQHDHHHDHHQQPWKIMVQTLSKQATQYWEPWNIRQGTMHKEARGESPSRFAVVLNSFEWRWISWRNSVIVGLVGVATSSVDSSLGGIVSSTAT